MARRSSSSRKGSRRSVKKGTFLRRSKARGAKLIKLVGRRYRVKGLKTSFARFGNAKHAANKIAYKGSKRRARRRR